MRLYSRITALLLCLILTVSAFPLTATALTEGEYVYSVSDDGLSVTITDYTGSDTVLTVPDTIADLPVTAIGNNAFEAHRTLVSITLPDTLKTIGRSAFSACTALEAIDIPASVESIASMAFYNCVSLTSITLGPSTYDIGYQAFHNTAWLVNAEDGPVYLGRVLYSYAGTMSDDATVTVKSGTAAIAPYAFSGRKTLKAVYLPVGLRLIGFGAFMNCSSLLTIRIPPSVTTVSSAVFTNAKLVSIYGVTDSAAHTYAEDNELYFVYDETLDYPDGDIDKDKAVTTADFRMLLLYFLDAAYECDIERVESADAYYDGIINTTDLRVMLSKAVQAD